MSDDLVAVDDTLTDFLVDGTVTIQTLRTRWPDVTVDAIELQPGERERVTVRPPAADPEHGRAEVECFRGSRGISVQVVDLAVAAEVLALIWADQPVPADGSIVVIHCADDVVPLSAGITAEQLLAVAW